MPLSLNKSSRDLLHALIAGVVVASVITLAMTLVTDQPMPGVVFAICGIAVSGLWWLGAKPGCREPCAHCAQPCSLRRRPP